jgi:hypothetical protein
MKNIDTLPQDIDNLFIEKRGANEDLLQGFLNTVGDTMRRRLRDMPEEAFRLRFSRLGTPDRKLWFEANTASVERSSKNALRFIYGDLVEALVLYLAKEAGHTVEDEQKEVVIDGVVGHQDAKIDGVTSDVKSASSFAFKKFLQGTLYKDDPFGYMAQLSGYMQADDNKEGAFVAVNKESGEITVLRVHAMDTICTKSRIQRMREVLELPEPPEEKCYEPQEFGKSGNLTLNKNCSYCPFKDLCWKDANNGTGLRKFKYSNGIVDFVKVVETPRVEEITSIQGLTTEGEQDELA